MGRRVLSVWELGTGLGHIDRMLPVGRALRARGHEPLFLLKDVSRAHLRFGADAADARWWYAQALVWLPSLNNAPTLRNYTVVLAAAGWLNPVGLASLVTAWRAMFELLKPDALVCDHAPTAMLAARGMGLPVFGVGNSFELPPGGPNFPPMAFWEAEEQRRCLGQDELLRVAANKALALLGDEPLGRLTDLFDGVHRCIMGLPELAHYDQVDSAAGDNVGPAYVADMGIDAVWPDAAITHGKPRVFVYINPVNAQFERLMAALKALHWPTLVFAKGMSPEAAARLGSPSLRFETQPLRMDTVLASAGLVISHGSFGTVTATALAGVPQLALPIQMEQWMVSRRIEQTGVGLLVKPEVAAPDWRALLTRLVQEPQFAAAAQALALRHAGASPGQAADLEVDRMEAVWGRR